jgi:hypothetical protein
MDTPEQNQDNFDARKDLLEKQFEEAEQAQETSPVEPQDSKDPPEAPVEPVEAATTTETTTETPEAEEPVWKRPPSSWKKEYHDAWEAADPKLREYAYQREEEMRAGLQPLLSKARFADDMQKAIAPYENIINGLGIDAPTAVKGLMQADYTLRNSSPEQKRAYLAQLAANYGINLGEVESMPAVDPTVFELKNELNNVRGEVLSWKQQQEQAAQNAILVEIDQFARTAAHFEEARPVMIQLLNSGVATSIPDAYNKAIRLDEGLFDRIQQGQQAKAEAEKREAANKAAKAAKIAAVSVRGASPGGPSSAKAQDRRSLLSEQLDGLSERF